MLSLPLFLGCLILIAIGIFGINYYNETRCASDRTEDELNSFSMNINRRILQAESETLKNNIYFNQALHILHSELYKLETSKIQEILKNGGEDSIKELLLLPKSNNLPKYNFDSTYLDAEILADKIDEILKNINSDDELDRRANIGNSEVSNSKINEEEIYEILTSKEKEEKCIEWLKFYSVVKGVSWGDLPYDLQKKWVCKYYYYLLYANNIDLIIINIINIIIINIRLLIIAICILKNNNRGCIYFRKTIILYEFYIINNINSSIYYEFYLLVFQLHQL